MTGTEYAVNLPMRGGVTSGMDRITNMPRCKITRLAAISVAPGVLVTISWDSNSSTSCYDTDGMWSAVSPTLVIARTTGVYKFSAHFVWATATLANSYRQMYFQNNVTGRIFCNSVVAPVQGVVTGQICQAEIPLNAGEGIMLNTAHNDSGALGLSTAADALYMQAALISTV